METTSAWCPTEAAANLWECAGDTVGGETNRAHTMPTEINSKDFGRYGNYWADSTSHFVVVDIISKKNQFDFCVCSEFNHTQCDCTCACVVACFHTSHFPFRMLLCH